jgi:hypothetical protein
VNSLVKRHLTAANILSVTALFVALGGTAYAAVKLKPNQVKAVNIANQAVTNPKIKTQAVTSGKIKNLGVKAADLSSASVINSKIANKAVTNAKLGNESVGGSKLAKKAVTESKLGAESVTTGKLGPEAVSSAKISSAVWHQLLKNTTYVTETSGPQSETNKTVIAKCPSNKEAIGGGVRVTGANSKVVPTESAPEFDATGARIGWSASAREVEPESGTWTLLAYAVCVEL